MNDMLPSNDNPFNPPSVPQKKETVTFNKKNLAIASLVLAVIVLIIAVVSISAGSSSDSSSDTTVPANDTPPVTAAPKSKYDLYLDYVLGESGRANTWNTSTLIEFGDTVCQSLDNGSSIRNVVNTLSRNVKDDSDIVFFAAVVRGAIENICPQYMNDLTYYLNN